MATTNIPGETEGMQREVEPLQLERSQTESAQKTSEGLKVIIVSSITFAIGVTVALIITIYCAPPESECFRSNKQKTANVKADESAEVELAVKPPVKADLKADFKIHTTVPPHGSVACQVPRCSVVGTDILKKGGSAVDAAIASTLCVGVIQPFHAGIGGGAFIMVRQHKKKLTEAIDAREVAPLTATSDMFASDEDQEVGPLSVAVPGELKGLALAHSRHGKLSWKEVVMPAVEIARTGFEINKKFADILNDPKIMINGNTNFHSTFNPGNGKVWKENDTMTNPVLANTLQKIAEEGVEAFYNGSLAKTLIDELQTASTKNLLSMEDMSAYTALIKEPITSTFMNHSVESFPAPGGGPVLLLILNMMEGFLVGSHRPNRTAQDKDTDRKLNTHRLVESLKFGYAHRSYLADPDFTADMYNYTLKMASKEYAELLRNRTDDDQTHPSKWYGDNSAQKDGQQTASISVIGPDEDHVTITSTLNSLFGSRILTSLGFVLNNEMFDFQSSDPNASTNPNNVVEPGKRPLSAMTPTLIHSRDRPCGIRVALGGTNGTRIISGVAQVILNLLGGSDGTIPLKDAIDLPRLHASLVPDQLEYEAEYDADLIAYLETMGNNLDKYPEGEGINIVHGVAKINETITGYSDPRLPGAKANTY